MIVSDLIAAGKERVTRMLKIILVLFIGLISTGAALGWELSKTIDNLNPSLAASKTQLIQAEAEAQRIRNAHQVELNKLDLEFQQRFSAIKEMGLVALLGVLAGSALAFVFGLIFHYLIGPWLPRSTARKGGQVQPVPKPNLTFVPPVRTNDRQRAINQGGNQRVLRFTPPAPAGAKRKA